MKALILASGIGKRMKPLTNRIPKCLVKVGEKTILGRIVDSLFENGINRIVITTGYLEDKIREFIEKNYPKQKFQLSFNPQYKTTNYIYSMWQARRFLENEDVLYLHGDLFYDSALLKKILNFSCSGALINRGFASKKDLNALIEDGLIKKIGVRIASKNAFFCLPIYQVFKNDFALWMEKISEYIRKGKTGSYAEDALNEITDKVKFYPVYFDKEFGMEIDDFEDLKKAEKFLKRK